MNKIDSSIHLIERALEEDIGRGDITTAATVDKEKRGQATIIAKQEGILAGIEHAATTFSLVDSELDLHPHYNNGSKLKVNDSVLTITGRFASILNAERTALNLLGHLSGIATLTALYVEQIRGTRAKITDTRKTTPLWRELEKQAVRSGGGVNHRVGLYDMILIKENHIMVAGSITKAVLQCRNYLSNMNLNFKIEVEVTNLEQIKEAIACQVNQIMLDNMNVAEMKESVKIIDGKAIIEASGGISLDNIKSVAETGVDLISVGALTHSAPVFDFSLLIDGA